MFHIEAAVVPGYDRDDRCSLSVRSMGSGTVWSVDECISCIGSKSGVLTVLYCQHSVRSCNRLHG